MNDRISKPEAYDDHRAVREHLAGSHGRTTGRQVPRQSLKPLAERIPGSTYGTSQVAASRVSTPELEARKIRAGFTEEYQLCAHANSLEDVKKRHQAPGSWTQLQLGFWAKFSTEARHGLNEW